MSEFPTSAAPPPSAAPLTLPPSFPAGEYTPHGYLDNPHHSMVMNPSGVIRSVPPLGFGYWRRTFKGCYGTGTRAHVNYLSILKITLAWDDRRLVSVSDFEQAGVELFSGYHSKHVMTYDFACDGLAFRLTYFLPREDTLACFVEMQNQGAADREVHLHALNVLGLWEQKWWGADGVGTRYVPAVDAAVSTFSAYGDYFALGASSHSIAHKGTADRADISRWLRGDDLSSVGSATVRGPGPIHAIMSYALKAASGESASLLLCLARGVNEMAALDELEVGLATARVDLEEQLDRDEDFWAQCPQLEGDWPEVWKRGWVYDWETLRMNVRPPLGIFAHHWDAMQVHSPRSVLGEAAVDALALAHADPQLAQDVLLGTFADAPAPNVPCCREDGSMNMVAADGEACGTAPSWCFPFHVIRTIYAATHDNAWISELYPFLKSYLDWWLAHRTDEHGWFHCKCDWESGQDGSKRFPESEGAEAGFVRTVDVEASFAEACRNMVLFAEVAGAPLDVPRWQQLADEKVAATREMFVDGWYRDVDTRTNQPYRLADLDLMMLSPLTCGIATPEQIEAIRPKFDYFRENPKHWLEWPSFFLAYTEAAWTAGLRKLAGEATATIADRIYPRLDDRNLRFDEPDQPFAYRVPGVACEYWPLEEDTEPGGEAYGWGATLPVHIIRSIVGFRETEHIGVVTTEEQPDIEFHLAPALPDALCQSGRTYTMRNLSFREASFAVRYVVGDGDKLTLELEAALPATGTLRLQEADGTSLGALEIEESRTGTLSATLTNGAVYIVSFSQGA